MDRPLGHSLFCGHIQTQLVSANILTEEDVQIHNVEGKQIIAITAPKADAQHRPVYIGNDPYRGAYRRCGEGDYRCTKDEIDTMIDPKV